MKSERDFALIQLNETETRQWRGPRGRARSDVQRTARERAAALAGEIGDKVEICAADDAVLEVVEAETAQAMMV